MFRSRNSRSVVAATASVVLILGLMAGTTSAKKPTPTPTPTPVATPTPTPTPVPTPTPNSDNRDILFGSTVAGVIEVTPVTTGGAFAFDLVATNRGSQNLSHAALGLGSFAAPWPTTGFSPSLPAGWTIVAGGVDDPDCADVTAAVTGYSCAIGALSAGASVHASFVVQTTGGTGLKDVWASFKVAENVNDQGANRNTFFASTKVNVGLTNSNATSTFRYLSSPVFVTTEGLALADGDNQFTTANVPNASGTGILSLFESANPTGCPSTCIGQTVFLNLHDGATFPGSHVEWTLKIKTTSAVPSQGGVQHEPDQGPVVNIPNTKANACSASKAFDCIVSYQVDKRAGLTTIVFRTETNGAARAW